MLEALLTQISEDAYQIVVVKKSPAKWTCNELNQTIVMLNDDDLEQKLGNGGVSNNPYTYVVTEESPYSETKTVMSKIVHKNSLQKGFLTKEDFFA